MAEFNIASIQNQILTNTNTSTHVVLNNQNNNTATTTNTTTITTAAHTARLASAKGAGVSHKGGKGGNMCRSVGSNVVQPPLLPHRHLLSRPS